MFDQNKLTALLIQALMTIKKTKKAPASSDTRAFSY